MILLTAFKYAFTISERIGGSPSLRDDLIDRV